jgi:hypothetical protein
MRCVQNAASATHVFANKEVAVARITNAISVERSTRMNHHRGVGVQWYTVENKNVKLEMTVAKMCTDHNVEKRDGIEELGTPGKRCLTLK